MGTSVVKATFAAAIFLFANTAWATVGYQFNGIGQYELGMSGAVVAAPGDAMIVISNPAGLSAISPQGDASTEIFAPTRTASFGQGVVGSHSNVYGTPALGWMVPIKPHHFSLGGGFFGTAGLGVNYLQQPYYVPTPQNPDSLIPSTFKGFSSISMMIAAIGAAWKPQSSLSLGFTLDMAEENVGFQETESLSMGNGFSTVGMSFANPATAYGVGITLGALYQVNPYLTVGGSYRSPIFFTPLTWQESSESMPDPATGGLAAVGGPGQYSMRLNYPQQITLGLALHPDRQWLISLQGQWINWHRTLNTVTIHGPWMAGPVAMNTHWKNTWDGSIGVQYTPCPLFSLRAGYAYGSRPINRDNLYANLLAPAVVDSQVSVGATETLKEHWQLVEAYMHAFRNTLHGQIPGTDYPVSTTLAENAFGLQVNYLF